MTVRIGPAGEEAAAAYLLGLGYRILRRNYRFGRKEIDIIARDGETIVFVEVKTRRSARHGTPEEAVTPGKLRRIRNVASAFLSRSGQADRGCRFDVIAVRVGEEGASIRHVRDIDA